MSQISIIKFLESINEAVDPSEMDDSEEVPYQDKVEWAGDEEEEPEAWEDGDLYKQLSIQERTLASTLSKLAHYGIGPFDKASGIWTGYVKGSANRVLSIGVQCSNCALYIPETSKCHILSHIVDPKGACRFACIPDDLIKK
jgi:hypothetical protein